MRILGIDPGTIKAGLTLITGTAKKPKFSVERIGYDQEEEKLPPIDERLVYMSDTIAKRIDEYKPELVIWEYPFNVKGNGRVGLELIGMFRLHCIKNKIPYAVLPQTRIKKYATGHGHCETSDVRMQVFKEFKIDAGEDVAISVIIAHFGMGMVYPSAIKQKHRIESIEAVKFGKKKKVKKEKPE